MDLKEYFRVIRRRSLEFLIVFTVILTSYWIVSSREVQMYTANVMLRIGERTDVSGPEAGILFLRNQKDILSVLKKTGDDSIRKDFYDHLIQKIKYVNQKIVDGFDSADEFHNHIAHMGRNKAERKLFFVTQELRGVEKVDSYGANWNQLIEAQQWIKEDRIARDLHSDEEAVHSFIRSRVLSSTGSVIEVQAPSVEGANSIVLHAKSESAEFSRWIINEYSHFVTNMFNELNLENVKQRLTELDRHWNRDDRNKIEREYNDIVFLYRKYLDHSGDSEQQRSDVRELMRKFPGRYANFDSAFGIDEIRLKLMEIINLDWRYKNARSYQDPDGGTNLTSEENDRIITQLQTKADQLEAELEALDEETQMLVARTSFEEDKPEFRRRILDTSEAMLELQRDLKDARLELAELKLKYTDEYPRVKALMSRVERTRSLIREFETDYGYGVQLQRQIRQDEINVELGIVHDLLGGTQTRLKHHMVIRDRIGDMQFYVDMLQGQRDRLVKQSEVLSDEVQQLTRVHERQRIVRVDSPSRRANPVQKTYSAQTMMLTVVMGFVISLFIIYVRESMDSTIKTENDVRRHVNLPIVAMIGQVRQEESMLTALAAKEPFAESFNAGAALIRSAARDLDVKTLMVTSTLPKEGKTTVATNFGIAMARQGCRVLVIDMDFRIPRVHEALGVDNSIGLSSWLSGRMGGGLAGATPSSMMVKSTGIDGLEVIPTGPIPEDPQALLAGTRIKKLIPRLRDVYDFIIIDTPPVFNVADALTVAGFSDATLFVIGCELVQQDQVSWAKHLLQNVNADILGVVMNFVRLTGRSYDYYYNGYKAYRARG